MGAALPATIAIAMTIAAVFSGLQSLLGTWEQQAAASRGLHDRAVQASQADLRAISATEAASGSYSEVDVVVANAGKLKYAAFEDWDVIVQYVSSAGQPVRAYIQYSATAADNRWRVHAFYLDASGPAAEVFEPGVLNPREEAILRIRVAPAALAGSTGSVTIVPPEGHPATVQFSA
jgi:hypothetical protein